MAKKWTADELLKVVKSCLPSSAKPKIEETMNDDKGVYITCVDGGVGLSFDGINKISDRNGANAVVQFVHGLCNDSWPQYCVPLHELIGSKDVDEKDSANKKKAAKEAPAQEASLDAAGTEEKHKKEILKDV